MPSKRSPSTDKLDAKPIDEQPALARIPRGKFVMTASFEGRRLGLCVELVQIAATEPATVSIALPKGQPISPLVRDAHCFGLCLVPEGDSFLSRRFATIDEEDGGDPFDALDCYTLSTGAPLIRRAAACFDCEVSMHIDCEADHELYIATVVDSKEHDQPADAGEPAPRSARPRSKSKGATSTSARASRSGSRPGASRGRSSKNGDKGRR